MSAAQNTITNTSSSANRNLVGLQQKSLFKRCLQSINRDKILWLMVLPGIVYYILFHYWPMYGIVIAFEKYSPFRGMLAGPWVGFRWFIEFFQSMYFVRIIKNTILLNILNIAFSFPMPIILALLLNEVQNQKFKKISQTISYMPHFISMVVIIGMVINFLSPSTGIVNNVIKALGFEPIHFMASAFWFRPIYIISGIWQHIGWGSIIYLAALAGIDQELYEAATMDGATKLKQLWHISIPGILPTIIIMLLLSLGSLLSVGYEKIILMYNPMNYATSDVISTYVYRRGLLEGEYSFGTAVGLFQSVINFILLVIVNKTSRRLNEVSLW